MILSGGDYRGSGWPAPADDAVADWTLLACALGITAWVVPAVAFWWVWG